MPTLTDAPEGVLDQALWTSGLDGVPQVGDLWLLSWNYEVLGLIVLSGVAEDFVMGWPVTLPTEPAFTPAFFADSPIGHNFGVWPTRETGVGMHLLHRRFGKLLSAELMHEIGRAIDNGEMPNIDFAPKPIDTTSAIQFSDQMIDQWQSICFNQWPLPSSDQSPFDREQLIEFDIKPSDLATIFRVSQFVASALYRGTRVPTIEQIDALAKAANVDAYALVSPVRDEGARLLINPLWKDAVINAGLKRSVSEPRARCGIQEEYAVAARFNGSREERLRAAIDRFAQ